MNTLNTIKKSAFAALVTFIFSLSTVNAQNDTMYIMKAGAIVGQYNVNTEVDSVIFYNPAISNPTSGSFTDTRDGNTYKTVTIGNQVWMAENLAYLPSVNMVADGSEDAAGSYYYVYGYDGTSVAAAKATDNYATYGVLYNYTAACNSCPAGWHLPSDAEWTELTDYLGGESVAGGKLKETGTTHWSSPNAEATNETGFTALPGGYRNLDGTFGDVGYYGIWWSATELGTNYAWIRDMLYSYGNVFRDVGNKELGFSVRCVRD